MRKRGAGWARRRARRMRLLALKAAARQGRRREIPEQKQRTRSAWDLPRRSELRVSVREIARTPL